MGQLRAYTTIWGHRAGRARWLAGTGPSRVPAAAVIGQDVGPTVLQVSCPCSPVNVRYARWFRALEKGRVIVSEPGKSSHGIFAVRTKRGTRAIKTSPSSIGATKTDVEPNRRHRVVPRKGSYRRKQLVEIVRPHGEASVSP